MNLWIITFFLGICTSILWPQLPSLFWLLAAPVAFGVWFFSKNVSTRSSLRGVFTPRGNPVVYSYLDPRAALHAARDDELGKQLQHKITVHLEPALRHVLIFILGFSWVLLYVHYVMHWSLPREAEGKKILITGYIASLPVTNPNYASFEFDTVTIAQAKISTKLKLNWYQKFLPKLHPGDKWQFLVKLKRGHGTANPGGFDAQKHLLVRKIRAAGYIINGGVNQIITARWYDYPLTRLRHNLILKMHQALANYPLAPVIIALVTGSEHDITPEQWRVMRGTGTSYLVAISGLHIGLVASIVLSLVQWLWRRSRRLPLMLPAKEAGVIVGLIIGFIYGAISGFSVPTQRALVMLGSFSVVTLLRRNTPLWNAWLWSVFLVLLFEPLAVLTIGFWLSFGAVAAILYASGWRIRAKTGHLANFWRMQLIVTLGLLPFTLLFFQQFSVVTLIANLLAMPGVCLVVVPISLLGAILLLWTSFGGGWVLILGAKILTVIWYWLTLWSNLTWANWYQPIYNNWILFATIIGVLLLLAPRGLPGRALGVVWLLPLFFYLPPKPQANQVWFTLLDVGQGLAAVVRTANHVLLYDTGPKFFAYDAGSSIIVPYLRLQGIKKLDLLVVSHGDLDHIGGAAALLQAVPVKQILTSVPEQLAAPSAGQCSAGQHWQWDGVDFTMLSPAPGSSFTGNEASCVLKITSGINSILLVGDIERMAEKALVANYSNKLNATMLVAAHHGSNTSSTQNFVNLVAPKYVLYPIGYKNRFHFPSKKVVARFTQLGAQQLDTATSGAITGKFDHQTEPANLASYRKTIRHFWWHE